MQKMYSLIICLLLLASCQESDNAIDQVFNGIQTGAILRTTAVQNLTVDLSHLERPIALSLEYQNGSDPESLDTVEINISFVDKTPENGDFSRQSSLYNTLEKNDFSPGSNGFPVIDLHIPTGELLTFFQLSPDQITCTDRFVIDLTLHLKDGSSFTTANSIGPIISLGGALNSPFTYDAIVVEGVDDIFITGLYAYESIQDGFEGATFITPEFMEITTARPNTRRFEIFRDEQNQQGGILVRSEVEFTIACDQAIMTRYVRSSIICGFGVEGDIHVLLGPATHLDNSIDVLDDTVFDLRFLEAFEGNDGFCGWPLTQSEIRFSKQ